MMASLRKVRFHQPSSKLTTKKQSEPSAKQLCAMCGATCCNPMLGTSVYDIYVNYNARVYAERNFLHLIRKYGSIDNLKLQTSEFDLWYLVPHIFGYCPFLDYPKNSCKIYSRDIRPVSCQHFPFIHANDNLVQICKILKHTNKRVIRKKTNQYLSQVRSWGKSVMQTHKHVTLIHQEFEKNLIARYRFVQHREDILLKVYSPIKESVLFNLEALVVHYAESLTLREMALDVVIIDDNYQLVGLVQGAYKHRSSVSAKDVSMMLAKYAYPGEMTHLIPEMLTTVVYDFELARPPVHWKECLSIIQKMMRRRN